jgi:hypothetical protein
VQTFVVAVTSINDLRQSQARIAEDRLVAAAGKKCQPILNPAPAAFSTTDGHRLERGEHNVETNDTNLDHRSKQRERSEKGFQLLVPWFSSVEISQSCVFALKRFAYLEWFAVE